MKPHPWLLSPLLSFFIVGSVLGQTYPTNIRHRPGVPPQPSAPSPPTEQTYPTSVRYQSDRQFPSLQKKLGPILGIAPFKDDRSDKPYVGHQSSFQRVSRRPSLQTSHYFKSEPSPLERAISDSIAKAVSRSGIKTVPVPNWDKEPKSMKNIGADSVLMIEIKRFWTEGILVGRGTKVVTSVYLVIHLGVKKKGKVFTRNVYVMKESTVASLAPAEVEQIFNGILTEILDDFFSNPY